MKRVCVTLLLVVASTAAFAQDATCSSIKSDKLRLACYDKGSAVSRPSSGAETSGAGKQNPKQFSSHAWAVDETVDGMTDKKSCTALYNGAWTVQASINKFFISMRGRGGVKGYRLRFDDDQALEMRLATEAERKLSAVILSGGDFDRVYNGKRLRVSVFTVLSDVIVEDVDLTGLRDSLDYMQANCQT